MFLHRSSDAWWRAFRAAPAITAFLLALRMGVDIRAGDLPGNPAPRIRGSQRTHWAFQPVRRPVPPVLRRAGWAQNPIDAFVLRRLESAGLAPSAPADRAVMIRRAYFDLLGLPPGYPETASFVADPDPGAYGRLIDRLLARPEYGERWGRHWLDVARYADTKGYVDAGERRYPFAYTYRDYVINAFNGDLPYNRFVIEQLAADRLVGAGPPNALAALGFLTVGSRFNFFPREIIDDRIDVVTRGLMGLTVTCARCHDHKYDPITQTDYYGLYSVFASSMEPAPDRVPVLGSSDANHRRNPTVAAGLKKVHERGDAWRKRRRQLHQIIMNEMRGWAGDYLMYLVQTDPRHRTEAQPPLRTERGVLREASAYGRGGVRRWRRYVAACGADDSVFGLWNRLVHMDRQGVAERIGREIAAAADQGLNPILAGALRKARPKSMVDVARVYGVLLEQVEAKWRKIHEHDPTAIRLENPAEEALRQVLYGPDAPATIRPDEAEDLYLLDEHSEMRKLYAEVERAWLAFDAAPHAMALVDRPQPIEQRVLVRGDPNRPSAPAPRRFLRMLSFVEGGRPFAEGSGRLELARAIATPKNPLTARVMVNRIWQWHMGRPLVSTPSDFGTRSTPPTHPDLLDYLASWFMDHDWSIKALHRLIMLSNTYRQRSAYRPECGSRDPANQLLWRMTPRRLDYEAMHDSLLAVSGELEPGGNGPPAGGISDPENRRRTVFCLVDRELLPGLLRIFDFPTPDITCPQRSRTTVPQQALFMFNSPFVTARAVELAARSAGDARCTPPRNASLERIRRLYQMALSRDPTTAEIAAGKEFLSSAAGQQQTKRAETRLRAGGPAASKGPANLTAWEQYAQALLESNEFLFVD